jgi:putative membrane protein insertion efficiency factor
MTASAPFDPRRLPARAARGAIRIYQLTLSALVGRQCRHLPTCSAYADEAIARHGLWPGGWMALGRVCRCRPGGTDGFDPVPSVAPTGASPTTPWRYARWR